MDTFRMYRANSCHLDQWRSNSETDCPTGSKDAGQGVAYPESGALLCDCQATSISFEAGSSHATWFNPCANVQWWVLKKKLRNAK